MQYLKAYADRFGLWQYIQCSTTVVSIRPHPSEPGHIIELQAEGHFQNSFVQGPAHYHVVAICTGLNREPFLPDIPGLTTTSRHLVITNSNDRNGKLDASSGPAVMHSSAFKSRAQLGETANTVLVLGVGETAMDLAHLAVTATPGHRVIMSHRDGFAHAPKIVPEPYRAGGRKGGPDPDRPNKPLDCAVASLFDTAYVPAFIQRGPLQWIPYQLFVKNMAWLISGTRAGFDQWVGGIGRDRFHIDGLLFCKSGRAIPYISEQWRSKSAFNRWRTWLINMELKPTGGRKIDIAPWPSHFDEDGVVHFQKTDRPESKKMDQEKGIRPDIVIFATGYKRSFPFLPRDDERYPSLEACTTRGIYRDINDGIAYIGFVRPSFGKLQILLLPTPTHHIMNSHSPQRQAPFPLSPSSRPSAGSTPSRSAPSTKHTSRRPSRCQPSARPPPSHPTSSGTGSGSTGGPRTRRRTTSAPPSAASTTSRTRTSWRSTWAPPPRPSTSGACTASAFSLRGPWGPTSPPSSGSSGPGVVPRSPLPPRR